MGLNQNIKAGKAAADNFPGRCDRSGIQAVSIPPRPDGRYPDWVAIDRSWPGRASAGLEFVAVNRSSKATLLAKSWAGLQRPVMAGSSQDRVQVGCRIPVIHDDLAREILAGSPTAGDGRTENLVRAPCSVGDCASRTAHGCQPRVSGGSLFRRGKVQQLRGR